MSRDHRKAMAAAIALSKFLSLPSNRGSVFSWHDSRGDRLILLVDHEWIATHRDIPQCFQGYQVVIEDQFDAIAHKHH